MMFSFLWFHERIVVRAAEMDQQRYLMCKREDLSSNPSTHIKTPDTAAWTPITIVLWRAETEGLLGLASHQLSSMFSERPYLKDRGRE